MVLSHEAHLTSLELRIDLVEQERRQLQGKIDHLLPENARLKEALGNEAANGKLASLLITIGGLALAYAGYAAMLSPNNAGQVGEGVSHSNWVELAVASSGAAFTVAGISILALSSTKSGRPG
jgi:hypothetical protein